MTFNIFKNMLLKTPVGPKMENYVVNNCCLKSFFLLFNNTRNMYDKNKGHQIIINKHFIKIIQWQLSDF